MYIPSVHMNIFSQNFSLHVTFAYDFSCHMERFIFVYTHVFTATSEFPIVVNKFLQPLK